MDPTTQEKPTEDTKIDDHTFGDAGSIEKARAAVQDPALWQKTDVNIRKYI
jgi:hypothetical protein